MTTHEFGIFLLVISTMITWAITIVYFMVEDKLTLSFFALIVPIFILGLILI